MHKSGARGFLRWMNPSKRSISSLAAMSDSTPTIVPHTEIDYNLKFTIDFYVMGTIYDHRGRNSKGKFIPVVLGGYEE